MALALNQQSTYYNNNCCQEKKKHYMKTQIHNDFALNLGDIGCYSIRAQHMWANLQANELE